MASFDKAIPPGQEGKVTLKVNTNNKKGAFKQSATIWSDDSQTPTTKIYITGSIKQHILVEPGTRLKMMGYYGDIIKKEVTITSLEDKPFEITSITSNIEDKIEYKIKDVHGGKKYILEVQTRSGLKEPFQGRVVLKTSHQKKPELEFLILGKLKKEIKVVPEYLYFGIIDTGKDVIDPKSLMRTVMISKLRGDDLTIQKIETSKDWITTETETHEKGEKYLVLIKLKDKLPKGNFRENITIHTEQSKRTGIANIIIEGKVK